MIASEKKVVKADKTGAEEPIGHDRILELLKRSYKKGRLAHAYLFTGPAHVGKTTAARHFAGAVLGHSGPLEAHPDFNLVERRRDEKTGKAHKSILLEQVRALCDRLSMGAFMNGWKVCILSGAHLLNKEAANALLKTLEEPHPKTLLLLTATSAENVMPTIRSRCQVVNFGRVASSRIRAALRDRGVAEDEAGLYSRLADGCPGKAFTYASEPESLDEMRAIRKAVLQMVRQDIPERWSSFGSMLPKKHSYGEAVIRTQAILDVTAELLRDALLLDCGRSDEMMHIDVRQEVAAWTGAFGRRRILSALEELEETRARLRDNVNPKAALEHLALSFPR